ncbi:MAG: hypothetical protein IKM73_08345 [Acidaminococcaceae bacterium]|nr:hypothetical protein [Acidaminococcaceae bacterium]
METTENNASNRAILMQYNFIVQEPLAGSEPEDVARQSRFLQDAGIEGMTAETADTLADYFVRCQRLFLNEPSSNIADARHETGSSQYNGLYKLKWDYWILTASNGTEYWFSGTTVDSSFYVHFIFRDSPEGEILYGYYR